MKQVCICVIVALFIRCANNNQNDEQAAAPACFDTLYPVVYNCSPAENGDYAFRTIPSKELKVKLLPNMEAREKMGMKTISGISGIHEFLLDHDLTSGFVHQYTQIMFNRLGGEDFVLKYKPDSLEPLSGTISFIHKKEMNAADTLGKTIAFFRQWRLSEIDYKENVSEVFIFMDTCKYYTRCVCPQSKKEENMKQIPFWHRADTGCVSLEKLSAFGAEDGGTTVIVWEKGNETWFRDIHSSWKEIFSSAMKISKQYHTDPAICISDAGPFARKLRADKNFTIKVSDADAIAPYGKRFGAGYGYRYEKK